MIRVLKEGKRDEKIVPLFFAKTIAKVLRVWYNGRKGRFDV